MTPSSSDPAIPSTGSALAAADRLIAAGLALWAVGAAGLEALVYAGELAVLVGLVRRPSGLFAAHGRGALAYASWVITAFTTAALASAPLRAGAPWSALHLGLFPLAILGWRAIDDPARDRILRVLGGALAASALFAVLQHYVAMPSNPFLHRIEDYLPVYRTLEPAPGGGYKAGGFHLHRLRLAHTLVPLGLALAWRERSCWRSRERATLALLLGVLSAAALRFTYARAAAGAAILGGGALVVAARIGPRLRARLVVSCLTAGALVPLLGSWVSRGPADRLMAWRNAWELFARLPVFGVGYGGYRQAALALNGGVVPSLPHIHNDAHATWLMFAAEGGLVGLALVGQCVTRFARLVGAPSAGQAAVLVAFAVLSVTHNLAFHDAVPGAFALALAIADEPGPSTAR